MDNTETKKIGRPKSKIIKMKATFQLEVHTLETLNSLQESTGRTKSGLIDLAIDYYAGKDK